MTHPLGRLAIALLGPVLILLGFGVSNLDRFADELARPALLLVLLVGRYAMGGAYRFKIETERESKPQVLIPLTVITLTVAAMLGLPWLDAHPQVFPALRLEGAALRWAGVLCFAAGVSLQAWSTSSLGRWFSPRIAIQPEHELIRTGPYAYVRHPFYTGLLASLIGLPAVFGLWVGAPLAIPALALIAFRVRVEERLLEAKFGDAYRALRADTKALIPFVY